MALADYVARKPVIGTVRLVLRALERSDVPALLEWMPDPALYRFWGKTPGRTDKNPALLFAKPGKASQSFHLGIVRKDSGKAIGELWVYLIEGNRMAKIAIRLGRPHQGRGFASEALRAMIDFCFARTELQRIWTDVDVRNDASVRLLERCGFIREGRIRQGKMVSTWCDYYLYGLLRSDIKRS
ncbi:MAG: GNAT family N-acetyltransferase [Kiritimatiellae bacterium]|nr:GNAT family N-acetyltransferase [Kiritimatiellia bacterium]